MPRPWLGFFAFALFGCAGTAAGPHAAPPRPAAGDGHGQTDDALPDLFAELPAGADRCVLARPSRLTPEHRGLFARVSQAEAFAWLPELALVAYASVERDDRDGPSARVSVLVLGVPPARARALLEAQAGVALDWSDGGAACTADTCPLRARFTELNHLRVERGVFDDDARPGSETACRELIEKYAGAVEISSARAGPDADFELNGLPLRTSSVLRPSTDGFHVARTDLLHSVIEAEAALQDEAAAGLLLGQGSALGSNVRRAQHGAAVRTEYDVLWDDLELARDDDQRTQLAEREADARERARPAADTGPQAREAVESELGYRLDLARRAPSGERAAELGAARALLEHALERTPDDEGLALLLCELTLSELHDPSPVAALVKRFADRPGARSRWDVLRRNAAALEGEAALADQIGDDALVPRRRAVLLAHDILARMHQGMAYELAERAALDAVEH